MKKFFIAFTLLIFTTATAFAGTAVATSSSGKGDFELTLTSVPGDTADVAVCTAVLKNTKTNEVLAAPKITFKVGEAAETSSTDEHSRFTVKLTSDAKANRATAEVEYAVNGEVVFAPNVTFELR